MCKEGEFIGGVIIVKGSCLCYSCVLRKYSELTNGFSFFGFPAGCSTSLQNYVKFILIVPFCDLSFTITVQYLTLHISNLMLTSPFCVIIMLKVYCACIYVNIAVHIALCV